MSKKEVLDQVYPDELEIIYQKKKEREIVRHEGYRHNLVAIAAGMGGRTEDDKPLYGEYMQQLNDTIDLLAGEKSVSVTGDIDAWFEEYEVLKNKETPTPEEQTRITELKKIMNDHIDGEVKKLKHLNGNMPAIGSRR